MTLTVGFDTGGTYTDAVLFEEGTGILATAKALTTRHDLAIGLSGALDAVLAKASANPEDIGLVSLSTTLATNAVVEGQGGRVALILIGFEEESLARHGLDEALKGDPAVLLNGGHDPHGNQKAPLDLKAAEAALDDLPPGIAGFAVAGLFAVRNPDHENAIRDLIREKTGKPVTCSHELSARLNGPKRALTSVLNARLISLTDRLIGSAERLLAARNVTAPIMVVRGDGSLMSATMARTRPIETIMSGPAASIVGAGYLTGNQNALVSDIGGTTTDVAALRDGQPDIDPEGAAIAGWRTMVEAVAIQTTGLGGDSEVSLKPSLAGTAVHLGPRRVIPVSLFANEQGDMVMAAMERQLLRDIPSEWDGQFAAALDLGADARAGLSEKDRAFYDVLLAAPGPLDRVLRSRRDLAILNRLVAQGLAMRVGFTPSDAAHVLGLYENWNRDAACAAARLLARARDMRGSALAETGEAASRIVLDALTRQSADFLLDIALEKDGYKSGNLSQHEIVRAGLAKQMGMVATEIRLTQPVIGLGASAGTYYEAIAAALGTRAIVPEHAGVANAIGAIVGQVRVVVAARIVSLAKDGYRLSGPDFAPEDFADIETAAERGRVLLAEIGRERARAAGADDDAEGYFKRTDKTVDVQGETLYIEGALTMTFNARPAFE